MNDAALHACFGLCACASLFTCRRSKICQAARSSFYYTSAYVILEPDTLKMRNASFLSQRSAAALNVRISSRLYYFSFMIEWLPWIGPTFSRKTKEPMQIRTEALTRDFDSGRLRLFRFSNMPCVLGRNHEITPVRNFCLRRRYHYSRLD